MACMAKKKTKKPLKANFRHVQADVPAALYDRLDEMNDAVGLPKNKLLAAAESAARGRRRTSAHCPPQQSPPCASASRRRAVRASAG